MLVDIELNNYRAFPFDRPARFTFGPGFTAFVGPNNTGKSSLLRFFYDFRSLFRLIEPNSGNFVNMIARGDASSVNIGDVACNTNSRPLTIRIRLDLERNFSSQPDYLRVSDMSLTLDRQNRWTVSIKGLPPRHQTGLRYIEDSTCLASFLMRDGTQGSEPRYTLDLRDMFEQFKKMREAIYLGAFRNAITVDAGEPYFDIAVGASLVKQWRTWKTGPIKNANEAIYRLTQSLGRIFGFNSFEINASEDGRTLQVFADGRSYTLSELGAGLAHFIIVLANVATRQSSYILIDEPELSLHPSLQLDFLTTLGSYAQDGVIFATHSIGLARSAANHIYSIQRHADGLSEVSEYERTPRMATFLGELSFSGYQELGFEKVLLVEGPSDVLVIQQLLRLYQKDHQVVLLPLGGGEMINAAVETQLREIQRISTQISALIDSERLSVGKPLDASRRGFVEACETVGFHCLVLERRAIENYFPERAIQQWKGEKYHALSEYQRLAEAQFGWAKADNWRIARLMTTADLDGTDLGSFLRAL